MRQIDERDQLISAIGETQRELGRIFAHDRSLPLMLSSLTMRQLKVVMILSSIGSAAGQDLAHHLGVGLGTVTGIVDRLVAHGLVTRKEDPHDRRVRRVELTPRGVELTEEMADAGLSGMRRLLERLDLETLRMADHVTRRLVEVATAIREENTNHPTPKVG